RRDPNGLPTFRHSHQQGRSRRRGLPGIDRRVEGAACKQRRRIRGRKRCRGERWPTEPQGVRTRMEGRGQCRLETERASEEKLCPQNLIPFAISENRAPYSALPLRRTSSGTL